MKSFGLSVLLIMVFAANLFGQSEGGSRKKDNCSLPVANFRLEAPNINRMLSEVAYKYSMPITLEVARDDDLLEGDPLTIDVKKGNLADVLESIVAQQPFYRWECSGSTIKVFPKSEFRDPLLPVLLETRISHFVIPQRTARLTFKQRLANSPELKNLLAGNGVQISTEFSSSYEIRAIGYQTSLDLRDVTVRTILDSLFENSQTRYWFVRRSSHLLIIAF